MRQQIFFFVLETKREIYWVYANISCAAYPLKDVDTISETGKIDTKSVLHLILNKVGSGTCLDLSQFAH